MKQKTKELLELSIYDAISNLSTIADMEIDLKTPLGFVKKNKLVIQDEEFSYKSGYRSGSNGSNSSNDEPINYGFMTPEHKPTGNPNNRQREKPGVFWTIPSAKKQLITDSLLFF